MQARSVSDFVPTHSLRKIAWTKSNKLLGRASVEAPSVLAMLQFDVLHHVLAFALGAPARQERKQVHDEARQIVTWRARTAPRRRLCPGVCWTSSRRFCVRSVSGQSPTHS